MKRVPREDIETAAARIGPEMFPFTNIGHVYSVLEALGIDAEGIDTWRDDDIAARQEWIAETDRRFRELPWWKRWGLS